MNKPSPQSQFNHCLDSWFKYFPTLPHPIKEWWIFWLSKYSPVQVEFIMWQISQFKRQPQTTDAAGKLISSKLSKSRRSQGLMEALKEKGLL